MAESSAQQNQPLRISRDLAFRLVVSSLALLTTYFLLLRNVASFELWGALTFGAVLDQAGFPQSDVFSYTAAGDEWIDHGWGASVLLFRLLRDGGSAALFTLKVLLFVAALSTAATVYRSGTTERNTSLADAVFFLTGLPCCYLLLDFYTPTGATGAFSVLGFLATLWILDTYRRAPATRAPWLLPPMVAISVNLGSGFVFTFFALGVHLWWFVRERRRTQATELAIVVVFCLGATLLNPYGWRFVPQIIEAWTTARAPIGEWGNGFSSGPLFAWTYTTVAVTALSTTAINSWHDRRFPGEALLLSGTAILGWLYISLVPFFYFTMLALGAPEILRLVEHYDVPERLRDYVGLVFPAGLGAAATTLIVLQLFTVDGALRPQVPAWNAVVGQPADRQYYPAGAVAFLDEQQETVRLWCPVSWGEFLTWRLYPKVLVSIDGRYGTLYPGSIRDDHLRFWGPSHDVSVADKYDTTQILVPASDAATLAALDVSAWVRSYEDPIAVLYSRTAPTVLPAARANDTAFVDELIGDLSRFADAGR